MFLCLLVSGHGYTQEVRVAVNKTNRGTYYVPIIFGSSQPVGSLVDTGSGYTVVPQSIIADLLTRKEARQTRELNGVLASGEHMTVPVYTITALQIGTCLFKSVEVAVFPERKVPILGLNVLEQLTPMTFSFNIKDPYLAMTCVVLR